MDYLAIPFLRQLMCSGKSANGRYLYLSNAKAGCSTVKAGLISRRTGIPQLDLTPRQVHGHAFDPLTAEAIDEAFTFSVARNPFTRIVSAYLDKITKPGILRAQFCYQYGLDNNRSISLLQFLENLQGGGLLDQHWRPQVRNLMAQSVRLDMVLHLEGLSEHQDALSERLGFDALAVRREWHKTDAGKKISEHLTPRAVELIREIYAEDFALLRYSPDLGAVGEYQEPFSLDGRKQESVRALGCIADMNANRRRHVLATPANDNLIIQCAQSLVDLRQGKLESATRLILESEQRLLELPAIEQYCLLGVMALSLEQSGQEVAAAEALLRMANIAPAHHEPRIKAVRLFREAGENDRADEQDALLDAISWRKRFSDAS